MIYCLRPSFQPQNSIPADRIALEQQPLISKRGTNNTNLFQLKRKFINQANKVLTSILHHPIAKALKIQELLLLIKIKVKLQQRTIYEQHPDF